MSDIRKYTFAFKLDTKMVLAPGYPAGVWGLHEISFKDSSLRDKPWLEGSALAHYEEKVKDDLCSVEVFEGTLADYLESKDSRSNIPGTIWYDRERLEPLLTPGMDVIVSGNGKKDFAVYMGNGEYDILRGRISEAEIEYVQPVQTKEEIANS